MDQHLTFIVPEAIVTECRAMCATWEGGVGMLTVPVYQGSTIVYYLSTGPIDGQIAQWLPYTDYSGEEPVVHEGDLEALVEAINEDNPEAGATVPAISAMLENADISNQSWQEAFERLGLSLTPIEEGEEE